MIKKTILFITLTFAASNLLYAYEVKKLKSIVPTTTGTIISTYTDKAPILDGKTDALWSKAKILDVEVVRILEPNIGSK